MRHEIPMKFLDTFGFGILSVSLVVPVMPGFEFQCILPHSFREWLGLFFLRIGTS